MTLPSTGTALRLNQRWTGKYRGVNYKVSLHGVGDQYRPSGTWCYYVLVSERQIPNGWLEKFNLEPRKDEQFGRIYYSYMGAWFADLDWHGGITYYEKRGGLDGNPLLFELGCDYAHYWDEGHDYCLEMVAFDARNTIDKLIEQCPLLVRCNWDGCHVPREQATAWGDGHIADRCISKRNEAFPAAKPVVAEDS